MEGKTRRMETLEQNKPADTTSNDTTATEGKCCDWLWDKAINLAIRVFLSIYLEKTGGKKETLE